MKHIIIAPEGAPADALQAFVVPDTRAAIELAVEAFLQRLDEQDGDPDREPNGDELDGDSAEDDFGGNLGPLGAYFTTWTEGAGCPISDAGGASWPEWHSRGRHKNPGWNQSLPDEDAEDDDAKEADGDETDGNFAEDEKGGHTVCFGSGPGCEISDAGGGNVEDEGEAVNEDGVEGYFCD